MTSPNEYLSNKQHNKQNIEINRKEVLKKKGAKSSLSLPIYPSIAGWDACDPSLNLVIPVGLVD